MRRQGPAMLRGRAIPKTTTDQRLLDRRGPSDWVHTDPWRVLRMSAGRRVRAAVLVKPKTIEMREFPRPSVGPDDALLRIEACGICGSDYEQYEGHLPDTEDYKQFPVIPGHESVRNGDAGSPSRLKRLHSGLSPQA